MLLGKKNMFLYWCQKDKNINISVKTYCIKKFQNSSIIPVKQFGPVVECAWLSHICAHHMYHQWYKPPVLQVAKLLRNTVENQMGLGPGGEVSARQ